MSVPDLSPQRKYFPALQQTDENGNPYVFFDGPGGSQVPQAVIDAVADYYTRANANTHGQYLFSHRTDAVIHDARLAMADFLNAPSPEEIVFGPTSTNLAFNISRSIGKTLQPGDEIIVTRLDHDANIAPWLALTEHGAVIKFVDIDVETCTLDMAHFDSLLSPKTKLVAVGYASNAVGTINPVKEIDCDFLMCSAYKFFAPHMAVVWGRYNLLEALPAYKVRPAEDEPPHKFEQGTGNFEGMAGVTAAINYLADIGEQYGQAFAEQYRAAGFSGRRLLLKQAMAVISAYERELFNELMNGLQRIDVVQIYGITNPAQFDQRTPTAAFTKKGVPTAEIARILGDHGIFVWDGHYYAIEVVKRLGLYDSGGMIRVGLTHYNTRNEIDRLLNVLQKL